MALCIALVVTFVLCGAPVTASERLANGRYWANTPRDIFFRCSFPTNEREAVRKAMQKWNAVKTPTNKVMVSMYLTTNSDERNVIRYTTSYDKWIGYTDASWDHDTGEMYTVEILLTDMVNWSVGGSSTSYDIQTVVEHELGHTLGVAHCHEEEDGDGPCWSQTCLSNVMYWQTEKGEVRTTLTSYDKASYIDIYW